MSFSLAAQKRRTPSTTGSPRAAFAAVPWSTSCGAVTLALVLSCGFATGCKPAPASTPTAAVDSYASAVREKRYADAYALLSQDTRANLSLQEFETLMRQNGPEVEALLRSIEKQEAPPLVTAEVRAANGEILTLVYQDGAWRIDANAVDLYSQRTPREAIASFVRAFDEQRYDVLMRFVPQKAVDEGINPTTLKASWEGEQRLEMQQVVEGLRTSLEAADLEVLGDRATMSYGSGGTAELVLEQGVWKIENFQ